MSRLPVSLIFLLMFVALVGVQAVPILGIVLAMLGSAFIAGFLVHAFLVCLAVDAIRGRVWRGLIVIPILAYGGYYAMYGAQWYEIEQKSAQMRAANPGKIFDFDPDLHSLVAAEAGQLVNSREIPVVYEANTNYPEGHLAYRLITREQCNNIKRDTQARVITYGVHFEDRFQQQVCQLRMPEAPQHAVVKAVKRGDEDIWKHTRKIMEQTTDLVFDGKVLGSYRTASVWRLPSFPRLVIGCGLDNCDYNFWRTLTTIDSAPNGVDTAKYDTPVTVMLGLRKYTAADLANFRGFEQNAPALANAAAEPARIENNVFAVLQQILDGQNVTPPHNMGYSIAINPQRLAPFASAMVKRLAELVAAPPNAPNRIPSADALAAGIGALPRAAYATVADRVFDLAHQPLVADRYPALYLRAADAGPHTFDFYKSAIMASRSKRVLRPPLALAVCRIGRADAETIAEFKRRFLDAFDDDLFVTLIKLGEEAFVRENMQKQQPRLALWANAVLAGEGTTETGPNNCMGENWGFTYPGPEMAPALEWVGHKGWQRRAGS
jgi:hypothetical protein